MNASKENAVRAAKIAEKVAGACGDDDWIFLKRFIEAARRKLPSEAALKKAKA